MSGLASEVRVQEESGKVRRIDTSAATVLAGAGVTERGPIGVSDGPFQSLAEWQKVYGGYTADSLDSCAAVQGFFDNGGQLLFWTRVVHMTVQGDPTTKTSAAATLNLQTAATAESAGYVLSAAQPFDLAHGDTLVVSIDGGGDQTFTFSATAASRESASGTFDLSAANVLTLTVNGGSVLTKTFDPGEFVDDEAATAAEVVASLNAFFAANNAGAVASVTNTDKVTITTVRKGTGASLNITGGSANAQLVYTTGSTSGTGDAANIDATTAAEVVAKLSTLAGGVASVVSGEVKITSSTTGLTSSVQVKASSTADDELDFDNAVHSGSDGDAEDTLQIDGKTDGEYGNAIQILIAAATSGDEERFNLSVLVEGVAQEKFFNLTMDDSDARYVETILNASDGSGSDLIQVTDLDLNGEEGTALSQRPGDQTSAVLEDGDDGLSSLDDTDWTGGETSNGTAGFRCFDGDDIDLLVAPGRATSVVHNGMVTYCEITRAGQCFAIMDPPESTSASGMVTYVDTTAALRELTEFAALYWPRIKVANPNKTIFGADPSIVVPPSGHVAGVYAKNDSRKVGGQFEHPAGIENGKLANVTGLEMPEVMKKAKRELVFPKLINPISREPGTSFFIDGARTLKSSGNWPAVGQRRGVIYVEKKLVPGLAFMRHRNINTRLYKEGERSINLFLLELTRNGCFKSTDPKKAFFVDLGAALNPPSVQAAKTVYARIGLATSEPAEFIVLLVGPDTRALDEELAALAA